MKILIDQDWLGRYRFYMDDNKEPLYSADHGSMIFKGNYANIYNLQGEKVLDLRQGKYLPWRLNKSTYVIKEYKGDRTIEVKCKNYKNGHWTINLDQNIYDIYLHAQSKKSLYKNEEQVARFGSTNGGHFVVSNGDEEVFFLVALFMTFKMGDSAPDDDLILELYDDERNENLRWQPTR